jgi:hypothetical protein
MLTYLSKWEDELEINRRDEDFKNLVFASDLWPRTLGASLENFRELFKEEAAPDSEEAIEWQVPESHGEIEEVLAAIAGMAPDSEPVEEHRV